MGKILFDEIYNHDKMVDTHNKYVLYKLLQEREQKYSISHKIMPVFTDHCKFINGRPYKRWHLIHDAYLSVDLFTVGSIYTSKQNEIGLFLFKQYQGMGYGSEILKLYLKVFPEKRYLANIHPENNISINFFKKFGFQLHSKFMDYDTKTFQHTYELLSSS